MNNTNENLTPETEEEQEHIWLTDEDGNEFPFDLMDVITYQDADYAVFFPADESKEDDESFPTTTAPRNLKAPTTKKRSTRFSACSWKTCASRSRKTPMTTTAAAATATNEFYVRMITNP